MSPQKKHSRKKATIFRTFVSDTAHIHPLIDSGADELIIEDPRLSIRSYADRIPHDESHLNQLIDTIQAIQPSMRISLNCDILAHQETLPKIRNILEHIHHRIHTIRIQDPGLIYLINDISPHLSIHLHTETGNINSESIAFYSKQVASQTLGNELPFQESQKICNTIESSFEIYVQGPLLIQYSPRRFLAGYNVSKGTLPTKEAEHLPTITAYAQAHEYPGRFFPFYDNPHGHFMYLYFDRCLLKSIPELISLDVDSWLIDGRGYTLNYTTTCLDIYRKESARFLNQTEDPPWSVNKHHITTIEGMAKRPQKPGFFKANNTDRPRQKKGAIPENMIHIGTVIDVIKDQCITIELLKEVKENDTVTLITNEGKHIAFTLRQLKDEWGHDISSSPAFSLAQCRWVKGCQTNAKLARRC